MSAKHLLALLGVVTSATVAGALALACSSSANDAGARVAAGGVAANSLAAKGSHGRDRRSARLGETSKEALLETKSHCPGGMIEIEAGGSEANVTRDFCIDRYEASLVEVLPNGDERAFSPFESMEGREVRAVSEPHVFPQGYISAVEAQHACAASGKRLCAVGEWRKACRGPEGRTFGYGNRREPGRCNDRGRNPVIALYGRGHWTWRTMNEPQLNQLENMPIIVLPGLLFTVLLLLPFVESWITGDKREHHLLQRPRNAPTRTATMVALMTLYGCFWAAGGNDIIAIRLSASINQITYFMRAAVFIAPVIAFIVTRRICISLQRHDNETLLHGYETGVIMRTPDGSYYEKHLPISEAEAYTITVRDRSTEQLAPAESADTNGVPAPSGRLAGLRNKVRTLYYADDVDKPTSEELEEAHHHAEHEAHELAALDGHSADGHHFDGRHPVSEEPIRPEHPHR